jgi:hypothetical protein
MGIKDIINIEQIKDVKFANKLYANLCNLVWYDYINDIVISLSWRGAGGFVAGIRNTLLNTNEDYMDFYCAGHEGIVDEEIEKLFNKNGIILFENFYDLYPDMNEEEKVESFKRINPIVVAYNRDKSLNKIL